MPNLLDYYIVPAAKLTALADSIRTMQSSQDRYTIDEMVEILENLATDMVASIASPYPTSFRANDFRNITAIRKYGFADMNTYSGTCNFENLKTIADYGCRGTSFTGVNMPVVENIGQFAFSQSSLSGLRPLMIPETIQTIGNYAFRQTHITTVFFFGTPSSMGNGVFIGCDNLSKIYVPWAEGEVAGAPWGASGATIYYNYRA